MNRLGDEPSRYLRQHADNPVDWYPWGAEAFSEAARRDVPLFVSVGYSACHWCHVMAHESFEDPDIAAVLNAGFVAVKVDREERPDVDAVYMDALVATEGHGGWPMSVFATPDGRPFLCGTYFPPADRRGMPGFPRVLAAVSDAWRDRRPEVEAQADTLAAAVARRVAAPELPATRHAASPGPALDAAEAGDGRRPEGSRRAGDPPAVVVDAGPRRPLDGATDLLRHTAGQLVRRLDRRSGGFGPAPKFPQPSLIELLLLHHHRSGDLDALDAATVTLGAMAAGGIYDHLAGGFARYSTDGEWTVPHFEKMLYDQAGLVRAYVHAWLVTGDERWRQVVDETVAFVLGALVLPEGGIAAAVDADSEGEEGRYYVWTAGELRQALGPLHDPVAAWYQVDGMPAFDGRHVLRRPPGAPLARPAEIEDGRRLLLQARAERVAPGRDDKVVTEWNAMFVSALAEASGACGRADWALQAETLGDDLWQRLRQPGTGLLMRTWQAGTARHPGCAADHAWMVDACTRLAERTGHRRWLARATELARQMLQRFADPSGLLAMTAEDETPLVARPVEVVDGATPSASAVAAGALVRLGALTGDADLSGAGEQMAEVLVAVAADHPTAMAHALGAASLAAASVTEVVVTAGRDDMAAVVRQRYEPDVVMAIGERTESPLWSGRPDDGRAYVCRGATCSEPATDPATLLERLRQHEGTGRQRLRSPTPPG